jgi:hypothetical protein
MSEPVTTDISKTFHDRVNDVAEYDGEIKHEAAYALNLVYKNMFANEDVNQRFETMEAERKKSVETLAEEYQAIQQQQLKQRLNEHSYPKSDLDTTTTILLYASIIISLPFLAIMVPINKVRSLFRNRSRVANE